VFAWNARFPANVQLLMVMSPQPLPARAPPLSAEFPMKRQLAISPAQMAKAPPSEICHGWVSDAQFWAKMQLLIAMCLATQESAPPIGAEHTLKTQLVRISSARSSEQLMAPPALWAEFPSKIELVIVTVLSFMRTAPPLIDVVELCRKVQCDIVEVLSRK
jgi:hypothetical protein